MAETYEHAGVSVNIFYDTDAESPREWDCNGCTILAWHRRADIGDKGFNYGDLPDFDSQNELEQWLRDEHGALHIRPLYLYEHGGMTISLGAFGDPWDSGQVGYVFVTQNHLDVTGCAPDQMDKLIEGDVSTYDSYLKGEVYGYVVDLDGPNEDSCWGFVGDMSDCKDEANSAAEYVAQQRVKEAAERAHWAARDTITIGEG